jgi:hypothetical protein
VADTWQTYLQPGESLLWEGAPLPGIHGKAKLIGLALFGLPFLIIGLGMAGTGIVMLTSAHALADFGLGTFITAFSLPFAGIGAFLVIGQWIMAAQAHRKVRYALSTRCAFIAQSYWKRSLQAYPILPGTAVELETGGSADTVWFHARKERDSDGDRTTTKVGFENIADGEAVFRLIRSIQTGSP